MLRKACAAMLSVMLVLSTAVYANAGLTEVYLFNPELDVTDSEVICEVYCIGPSDDSEIRIEVTLMAGREEVGSWSARGIGYATFYQTCPAEPDQDYKMIVKLTIDGELMIETVVRP